MTYSRRILLIVLAILVILLIGIAVVIALRLSQESPQTGNEQCQVGATKCQTDNQGQNTGILCTCQSGGGVNSYACPADGYDLNQCPANIFTSKCPKGTIYTGDCASESCGVGKRPQYLCNPTSGTSTFDECVTDTTCTATSSSSTTSTMSSTVSTSTTSVSTTATSSSVGTTSQGKTVTTSSISSLTTAISSSISRTSAAGSGGTLPDTGLFDEPAGLIVVGIVLILSGILVNRSGNILRIWGSHVPEADFTGHLIKSVTDRNSPDKYAEKVVEDREQKFEGRRS